MKFILPFPDHVLSPNRARTHWHKKGPAKKVMYDSGILEGRKCKQSIGIGRIGVRVVFYPPNLRWDMDGMFSAIKAGLDGLADGLGINDRQFRPFLLDCHKSDKDNPRVEITIYRNAKKDQELC